MKTNYFISSVLGMLALLMSNTVSATFLFNFGTNLGVAEGAYDSLALTIFDKVVGIDITVDITAFTITNGSNSSLVGNNVGVYYEGDTDGSLGVKSSLSGDARNIDGSNGSISDPNEGLLFSFDTLVRFDYIDFDGFNSQKGDDFNLTIDGVLVLSDINGNNSPSLISIQNNGDTRYDKYDFQGFVGKEFLFWADDGNDSFRIDELRVTAVPIPAAFLLFSTGLAWFGLMRAKSLS